ncbi:MAG: GNAT family N-acetyltransferase [Cyclobacteriaceae bacterium]|jgi:predicted GNAT family acetyltransferase|nr:N-acetyltransferase [Flammeovirgaceae bacterium]
MEIQREEHGSKGAFFISAQGKRLAEMTSSKAGDTRLIIDHTEVSDALKGKGAGKQLVTAAVNFARQQKIKILPLCPFARAVFEKTPEFADVWDN